MNIQQISKRLVEEQDFRKEIQNIAKENKITAGCIISAVGNLKKAVIRLSDGKSIKDLNESLEIVSIIGTISKDACHIHLSVANNKGQVFGGHLKDGCIVGTTAEIVLLSFTNLKFNRKIDNKTNFKELIIE